jgi:hypothetical protein
MRDSQNRRTLPIVPRLGANAASEKNFTSCVVRGSLLETLSLAIKISVSGDVILLSPGCSSLGQFRSNQHMGEVFSFAVATLATTTGRGGRAGHRNREAAVQDCLREKTEKRKKFRFASGFFEEKPRSESAETKQENNHDQPHTKGRSLAPQAT